jgi:hypothetical protein
MTLEGQVIAADPRDPRAVYRAEGDRLIAEAIVESASPMTRLASTPLGPVLIHSSALSTRFTVRREGGRWEPLAGEDGATELTIQRTYTLAPWRDGFVASGVYGFGQQRTATAFCAPIDGLSPQTSTAHMVSWPGTLVLSTGFSSNFPTVPASVAVATAID